MIVYKWKFIANSLFLAYKPKIFGFTNTQWILYLFSLIEYEFTIFSRIHHEFTIYFKDSLSVSLIHYWLIMIFREFTLISLSLLRIQCEFTIFFSNSLFCRELTMNSLWILLVFREFTITNYGFTIAICIEYVAHQCEKSNDSWTPSGVLYFLVNKSSWSLLGSTSKYDSGRLEQYMKNLRNFHKKYAFRPEIYLEVFQVQIRTTLYIRGVLWNALKSMWKINFSRDGICSFILKCPKFEYFQFLSLFCSNSHHVHFFWNARFSYVRLFWNAQFSIHSARKVLNLFENWAFQNKRTNKNRAFQKKSTWWEFEQKRERNWKCSNFGHFKKICICHHVKNISFTCFSGHFIIPPYNLLNRLFYAK